MSEATLRIRRFREEATLPTRSTDLAAGYDIYACLTHDGGASVRSAEANKMMVVETGLNLRIPVGYYVAIVPRSGLAFNKQITIQNTPGTIDADYDGDGESYELKVMLRNEGEQRFVVKHGDRIAQMIIMKLPDVEVVEDFEENTNRNQSNRVGGLGSTGVSK